MGKGEGLPNAPMAWQPQGLSTGSPQCGEWRKEERGSPMSLPVSPWKPLACEMQGGGGQIINPALPQPLHPGLPAMPSLPASI